jgi:hypothetical protein
MACHRETLGTQRQTLGIGGGGASSRSWEPRFRLVAWVIGREDGLQRMTRVGEWSSGEWTRYAVIRGGVVDWPADALLA